MSKTTTTNALIATLCPEAVSQSFNRQDDSDEDDGSDFKTEAEADADADDDSHDNSDGDGNGDVVNDGDSGNNC